MDNMVYVIGYNIHGGLLLNQKNDFFVHVRELTAYSFLNRNKSIISIYSSSECSIYRENNNNLLIANCYASMKEYKCDKLSANKINKICATVSGSCIFWICGENNVYANGYNFYGRLGIPDSCNSNTLYESYKLSNLNKIIDIQSADTYSIALQLNSDIAIIWYCKLAINKHIPNDIINVIIVFYGDKEGGVYSTGTGLGNGHQTITQKKTTLNYEWKRVDFFRDKNIIKIKTGLAHSLFL